MISKLMGFLIKNSQVILNEVRVMSIEKIRYEDMTREELREVTRAKFSKKFKEGKLKHISEIYPLFVEEEERLIREGVLERIEEEDDDDE